MTSHKNWSYSKRPFRPLINGAHVVVSSKDAEGDRNFFRDVLGLPSVDAGHGWLIFALHPTETNGGHELHLMCDNLAAEIEALREKGVLCSDVVEARWGSITRIPLPGGGRYGSANATKAAGKFEPPIATTMNCLPLAKYVMGEPVAFAGKSKAANSAPVVLS